MAGQKSNTTESKKLHNPKSHAPAVFIPCWLIQVPHKLLSFGAKLLYGRLAQWSNTNGDVFRSAPQLSKELGMGVRTIEKFIKELKDVGLIKTYHPQAGGQNHFRFFDHEWMNNKLVEELDPPHNHAAPTAQPCGTPPHNHADISIKEIKEIKDISESDDSHSKVLVSPDVSSVMISGDINEITNKEFVEVFIEECPYSPHPRNPDNPSKDAIRSYNALRKLWRAEISKSGKSLTKESFRGLLQDMKENKSWLVNPEKKVHIDLLCQPKWIIKFLEERAAKGQS